MANDYFQFKQFTVRQDKCAMKVCTDACLFGSLIPIFSNGERIQHILDIGTGTGLLSLMIAQQLPAAFIDAIEIDEDAATQAKSNFKASPWKRNLNVFHTSIQHFNQSAKQPFNQYDLIVSNPPFYENDLKANDEKRNIALHSDALSFEDLLTAADDNLKDDGKFAVLLPYQRSAHFQQLAINKNFYLLNRILIRQTPEHQYFRSILLLGKEFDMQIQSEIIIKNENENYTPEFIELLKDYYLYL